MTVAVVIPAYNEAATIADIVRRARQQVDWVMVVDDGSSDDSAARAEAAGATVLRQLENQGKGASLWRGMRHAIERGAEAVITLDADGQHCPEDIPVAGRAPARSRALDRRRAPDPPRPRARPAAFRQRHGRFWVSWAAGCPIADTQSGFRLYPSSFIRRARGPGQQRQQGFVFESALWIQAGRLGCYPTAVPIETIYHAQSRPSHYRPWSDTARIVRLVAGSLLRRGFYPAGLLRSLRLLPLPAIADEIPIKQVDSEDRS